MSIEITVDPLNKFYKHTQNEIMELCGIIPHFVVAKNYRHYRLKEALESQYGFPVYEIEEATISPEGVYSYPEDPDMYPLIKMTRDGETFYQYAYGIVAVIGSDGTSYVTRMD